MLVADTFNDRILRFHEGQAGGEIVARGRGASDALNKLSSPAVVAIDRDGNVLVADQLNNRILRFRTTTTTTTTTKTTTPTIIKQQHRNPPPMRDQSVVLDWASSTKCLPGST